MLMRGAVILNTRKRVIVALVHTVVFLALAMLTGGIRVRPLHAGAPPSAWILPGVYALVSAVLLTLAAWAGGALERLYFGCCAAAAGLGLGRQIVGDPPMHAAVYWRVFLLGCAVCCAVAMLRDVGQVPDLPVGD